MINLNKKLKSREKLLVFFTKFMKFFLCFSLSTAKSSSLSKQKDDDEDDKSNEHMHTVFF